MNKSGFSIFKKATSFIVKGGSEVADNAFMRKCLIPIILCFCFVNLYGETLYVAVSGEKEISEMDQTMRVNLTGLENGLMDFLFDSGHIFFNGYEPGEEKNLNELIDDALLFAVEKRTPYVLFIRFLPYEASVNYRLYDVGEMSSLESGSFNIDEKNGISYYQAGQSIGREIFSF